MLTTLFLVSSLLCAVPPQFPSLLGMYHPPRLVLSRFSSLRTTRFFLLLSFLGLLSQGIVIIFICDHGVSDGNLHIYARRTVPHVRSPWALRIFT